MNGYFNLGDWIVILAYLGAMIGIGIWFGKDQRNTRDYFLGSKNIPWWGIGVSIVAAETSALTIIGVPAIAYGGNIMFIQMIVGYVIARVILAVVMVPHYLSGEIYSPYQLLASRKASARAASPPPSSSRRARLRCSSADEAFPRAATGSTSSPIRLPTLARAAPSRGPRAIGRPRISPCSGGSRSGRRRPPDRPASRCRPRPRNRPRRSCAGCGA